MEDVNVNPIKNDTGLKSNYLAKTFLWMFFGLLATGIIAYYTYASGAIMKFYSSGSILLVALVEVIVAVLFSALFKKLSSGGVAFLYFLYSIINGIVLSFIFIEYEMSTIITTFFVSAAIFALFAFFGYKTKFDLSRISNILFGLLIAGIIISIANIFMNVDMIYYVVDWGILLVFFGVTAYDVQKIKRYYESGTFAEDKIHIYGAMEIYLDFINIFIRMLSIINRFKDN